ncbi:MAG: type VI secretion system contractile sheath large subunit [Pyrinomonadaceae bacterium]|nr:type VI secretion system contractile sheath large subunit [Pyrinomonadaceae bacterium]
MTPSSGELEAMFTMESERGGIVDEPPFRMLVAGAWSGTAEKKRLESRRPIEIDRDNFDEVMAKLGTSLDLDLRGDGTDVISLRFSELEDFHPDRIFAQVSLFAELRDVRRRLNNEDTFYEAAREVRSWFPPEEPSADDQAVETHFETADEPEDLLGQILTQPGGGAVPKPSKSREAQELNSLLRELVRPHLLRIDEEERAPLVSAVDSATGELMRRILHHHQFKALEAAWRGLFLMIRRVETASDLSIYILDASKDELSDDLKGAESLSGTALYRVVIKDAIETPGAEPWSLMIGAYDFSPTVDDVATLVRISKIAAGADAPFIAHMRPDVLGVNSLYGNIDPKSWTLSGETEAEKLWAALRKMPESEYLGMVIPRFLARLPYGADTEPLETFSFEEFDGTPDHDNYVWANAGFICGTLLAQSFSEHEWQMGKLLKQDLDGLPLHIYKLNGETVFTPCAEVQMTDVACDKLMDHGLMPLVTYKNTDHVKLARFQSITEPVTKLKGPWN